mgnify:CR=1 FL=1
MDDRPQPSTLIATVQVDRAYCGIAGTVASLLVSRDEVLILLSILQDLSKAKLSSPVLP